MRTAKEKAEFLPTQDQVPIRLRWTEDRRTIRGQAEPAFEILRAASPASCSRSKSFLLSAVVSSTQPFPLLFFQIPDQKKKISIFKEFNYLNLEKTKVAFKYLKIFPHQTPIQDR